MSNNNSIKELNILQNELKHAKEENELLRNQIKEIMDHNLASKSTITPFERYKFIQLIGKGMDGEVDKVQDIMTGQM